MSVVVAVVVAVVVVAVVVVAVVVAALVVAAVIWLSAPAAVPTHSSSQGRRHNFSSRILQSLDLNSAIITWLWVALLMSIALLL